MYVLRRWSTRHARLLELVYTVSAAAFHALDPLWSAIGFGRLDRPFSAIEAWTKGALFDCRMCGECVLSATGMTCPMNCPKEMRNGPCGGVRADGCCEVKPQMACVWAEAWTGAKRMREGMKITERLAPRDHRTTGHSAWLRASEKNIASRAATGEDANPS